MKTPKQAASLMGTQEYRSKGAACLLAAEPEADGATDEAEAYFSKN